VVGALAAVAIVVTAIAALRRRFVVVRVLGTSMEPVLREGQRVLVRRARVGAVQRGDLVVFALASVRQASPGDPPWMVKRAVALPGDAVPHQAVPSLLADDTHVPEGRLVVLGDNRASSFDSRRVGYIDGGALLGVVVRTLA